MSFASAPTRANSPAPRSNTGVKVEDTRIAVIMVGLPARGKSLIAQKMVRYLKWLSIPAKTFNVGNYRRTATPQPTADFFSMGNTEGERLRHAAAEAAVKDMVAWFERGEGIVAILDATNSTKDRRRWVNERCQAANIETLFVESKCDDEPLIMSNILEVKTTSPDYVGQDPEMAAQDFRERIRNYERVYQTINGDEDEDDLTYVQIIDVGTQVIINRIRDYLQSRVVYYLMNLHIKPRSIWLSRHGESEYNLDGKLGGDSNLSSRGQAYARALPALAVKSVPADARLTIWTSTLKRTIQTARFLEDSPTVSKLEWKALDELDSGVCDGLTYAQIAEMYPDDFRARDEDKYNYRYRGGESYRDVVIRLEPIIMELERSENVMIVTHQAVLRCIYAYYMDVPQEESPWMEVPLHTLIKLTPRAYRTVEERFAADIPAVSTFREKGSLARHQRSTSLSQVSSPKLEGVRSPRLGAAFAGAGSSRASPNLGASEKKELGTLPELSPPVFPVDGAVPAPVQDADGKLLPPAELEPAGPLPGAGESVDKLASGTNIKVTTPRTVLLQGNDSQPPPVFEEDANGTA